MQLINAKHRKLRRLKRLKRIMEMRLQHRIFRFFELLLFFMVLHIFAMMFFEKLAWWDALWLTATTVTTVGYGDISAASWRGQLATILLLYGPGITLLAQIAGDYIDLRVERRTRMIKGFWRWEMEDHIVIINTPHDGGERYLQQVVSQIRHTPSLNDSPVMMLTEAFADGLPDSLRRLEIVHYTGKPLSDESLLAVEVDKAKHIVVLCEDIHKPISDSLTLDILDRLKRIGTRAHIVAECFDDTNRERFRALGATGIIRPVRAYPSIVVRALAAPGSEELLENLFKYDGEHVNRIHHSLTGMTWGVIANKIMAADLGTPVGYTDTNGHLITNPSYHSEVEGEYLFILTDDQNAIHDKQIKQVLSAVTS